MKPKKKIPKGVKDIEPNEAQRHDSQYSRFIRGQELIEVHSDRLLQTDNATFWKWRKRKIDTTDKDLDWTVSRGATPTTGTFFDFGTIVRWSTAASQGFVNQFDVFVRYQYSVPFTCPGPIELKMALLQPGTNGPMELIGYIEAIPPGVTVLADSLTGVGGASEPAETVGPYSNVIYRRNFAEVQAISFGIDFEDGKQPDCDPTNPNPTPAGSGKYRCNCPDFLKEVDPESNPTKLQAKWGKGTKRQPCYHIWAVRILRQEVKPEDVPKDVPLPKRVAPDPTSVDGILGVKGF